MKRLLVYSHDTFGLGNIRRMLCICEYLLAAIPDLSILLVSGSPMVHSFRLPRYLDYIKLPCLRRTEEGDYAVRAMGTTLNETIQLRSDLLRTIVANFRPQILLVDKKPYGVENELYDTLRYLQTSLAEAKLILLLRDILDSAGPTIRAWEKHGYHEAIESFYDLILVVGSPEIFDPCETYQFPASVAAKVRFCGYIRRQPGRKSRDVLRHDLQLQGEKLILVTPGGGEDGYQLLATYVEGLAWLPAGHNTQSLIVCGPEMPAAQRTMLYKAAATYPHVRLSDFTDDMLSYVSTADVVVAMAGYNTVCEVLSLHKRAIVVPRVKPVAEQWIRAERMACRGLLQTIHPDALTPQRLMHTVMATLNSPNGHHSPLPQLDLNALPRIAQYISTLLDDEEKITASVDNRAHAKRLRPLSTLHLRGALHP